VLAGSVKTKEELLGLATTDDEEADEIADLIDTFRNFMEKPSGESCLDLLTYGKDLALNRQIRASCTEYPDIFNAPSIEVDRKRERNHSIQPPRTQTQVENPGILQQVNELLELGIIERSSVPNITPSAY
jgi:hypothetical protein